MSHMNRWKKLKAPFSLEVLVNDYSKRSLRENSSIVKNKNIFEFRISSDSFPFESRLQASVGMSLSSASSNHPQYLAKADAQPNIFQLRNQNPKFVWKEASALDHNVCHNSWSSNYKYG